MKESQSRVRRIFNKTVGNKGFLIFFLCLLSVRLSLADYYHVPFVSINGNSIREAGISLQKIKARLLLGKEPFYYREKLRGKTFLVQRTPEHFRSENLHFVIT